ncbi:unnamed protein product [Arctogadus glacialis]
MAIIGFSASRGIPGGMDIHAGIPEEGDPSREQWQDEDDEPRIAHQSTSAAPPSLPVMTAPSTSATISTPSTASTATASIIVRGCQCSQDLVELEREKVALLRDVCGLLRESADYQKEVIVLKRAKLDIMARQLALEEETRSSKLSNSSNVFFCEVRNDFGTEKSTVYKIDIQTPPRILPASSCRRIAAWVRCSCDSVGRPSPSLEWWLDGKLVLGSENVSVSQVNLENATLRSSLTMTAPAGLIALTCHSSNAAGNTSQELPVPHLETQPTLTEQLPWIAATAVLAAGLLFATVCTVRAWKMANRTRLGSDALLNKAPANQGNPQVFFRSGEDIYANIDTLMNTVGPREEPVGAVEEAVGLGEGAVGLGEGAAGLGEGAVGLGEGAAGLGEGAVGLGEGADCDVVYTTVKWKKKSKKKEI